jgi:hypothetical protein
MHRAKSFIISIAVLVGIGLAGCGADADPGTRDTGSAKARINMPDNFPTVAHKCYGPNGVYASNTSEKGNGSIYVVTDDPQCP